MQSRSASGLQTKRVEFVGNTSGWEAYDYKVIIKRDEVEKTYGEVGLVIADDVADREEWTVTQGVIVSCGTLAFTEGRRDGELVYWERKPEVGDRVMIQEYVGQRFIGDDGEKYLIVTDKEIAAGAKA